MIGVATRMVGGSKFVVSLSARGLLSPNYDPDKVEITLTHSDHWYLLSAALLAEAADNHILAKHFYNLFDQYDDSACRSLT